MKKVVILNSSPRRNGNSSTLAEELARGVRENGGEAVKIDLAFIDLKPCRGCYACQMAKGNPCVQKDDMQQVYDVLPEADAVVLATPLYWQQMNGVMKNAIDRLFALAGRMGNPKDTALIVSAATPQDFIFEQIESYFRNAFASPDVLGWNIIGVLKAGGLNAAGDAKSSAYMKEAYELGKKIATNN